MLADAGLPARQRGGGIRRLHQFCLTGNQSPSPQERHHNTRIIPIFIISCNTCTSSTNFLHDDDDHATPCICFTWDL